MSPRVAGYGLASPAPGLARTSAGLELIVTMRITVLGKSPSWEDAGGACSGYLVEDGDTALLLDCGNGVFSKLRLFRDYTELDAVLISHLHADHFLDLVPYAYALTYAPRQQPVPVGGYPGTDDPARPRLIAPSGARQCFRQVVGAWGKEDLIENAFALEKYDAGSTVEVGSLRARFQEVPHFTTTYAIDFTSSNGAGRFTYGADCRPGEELVEIARDTDLLLVEATLPRPERTGDRGHMTPAEAGDHARQAGAGRVVLTHISDELDSDWAREQGSEAFGHPVEMAREGAVYEV
jgi:ribonuclease BN (tRNA processing enzyme)